MLDATLFLTVPGNSTKPDLENNLVLNKCNYICGVFKQCEYEKNAYTYFEEG